MTTTVHDYWAAPTGLPWPDGYPRQHPGVWSEDALEILPAGCQDTDPGRWRAARLTGIGASDVSALLGLNKRTARMEVWEQKLGLLDLDADDEDEDGGEAAYWGTEFEPSVRRRAARKLGLSIDKPGTFRSARWPWLIANPDGLVYARHPVTQEVLWPASNGGGPVEGYEGKTCNEWAGRMWGGNQVPDHAELQCQTVMAVLGLDGMHCACLVGGQRLVLRYVARDDALIKDIVEITEEFWHQYVLTGDRPPPDGGPACEEYLVKRYAHAHVGTSATACDEDAAFIRACRAQESAAQTYVKAGSEGKNLARSLIGDREQLVDPGGDPVATWRHTGKLRLSDLRAAHPDETAPYVTKVEVFDEDAFAEDHEDLHTEFRGRVLLIKAYRTPTTRKDHDDG